MIKIQILKFCYNKHENNLYITNIDNTSDREKIDTTLINSNN